VNVFVKSDTLQLTEIRKIWLYVGNFRAEILVYDFASVTKFWTSLHYNSKHVHSLSRNTESKVMVRNEQMSSIDLVPRDVIFRIMKTEIDPRKRQKFNDY
jgi:predicted nucleic acid-binding Zn finger protein